MLRISTLQSPYFCKTSSSLLQIQKRMYLYNKHYIIPYPYRRFYFLVREETGHTHTPFGYLEVNEKFMQFTSVWNLSQSNEVQLVRGLCKNVLFEKMEQYWRKSTTTGHCGGAFLCIVEVVFGTEEGSVIT